MGQKDSPNATGFDECVSSEPAEYRRVGELEGGDETAFPDGFEGVVEDVFVQVMAMC